MSRRYLEIVISPSSGQNAKFSLSVVLPLGCAFMLILIIIMLCACRARAGTNLDYMRTKNIVTKAALLGTPLPQQWNKFIKKKSKSLPGPVLHTINPGSP